MSTTKDNNSTAKSTETVANGAENQAVIENDNTNANNDAILNDEEEEAVQAFIDEVKTKSHSDIIKEMVRDGATLLKGLKVRNVNFDAKENHTQVSVSVDRQVRGFVLDEATDTFKLGSTATIFSSTFAISGALKETDDWGWLANLAVEKPGILNLLLNGSKVNIIQQYVKQGEEYRNPFSQRAERKVSIFDHDTIINNVVHIDLGKSGQMMAMRIADKVIGDVGEL